jgi:hypothetical protein
MVETQHEMAGLDEKNFETKKIRGWLVVASFVFAESQMAVCGLSSELKDLAAGC